MCNGFICFGLDLKKKKKNQKTNHFLAGCNQILQADCVDLIQRLNSGQQRYVDI